MNRSDKTKNALKENDMNIECLPLHSQPIKPNNLNNFLINVQDSQVSKQPSQTNKKKSHIIQIYMKIPKTPKTYLDPIEDLDFAYFPTMNQWIGVYKHNKSIKETNLVSIDTEKKKEAVLQMYKSLYSRNSEAEKTIKNYSQKNIKKERFRNYMNAQTKFEENLLENYTQEYFEKLYTSSQKNYSLIQGRHYHKKLKTPLSFINQYNSPYDTQRPSSSITLRGARSNGNVPAINYNGGTILKEIHQSSFSHKITSRKSENNPNEDINFNIPKHTPTNPYPDHYFRIMKAANLLHKPPRSKNEIDSFKAKDKSEHNTISSSITNLLERLYLNSSKIILSEESLSPSGSKGLTSIDDSSKKPTNIEDEFLTEKNYGLSLVHKSQASSSVMYKDIQKKLFILERRDSKENKNGYNVYTAKIGRISERYGLKDQNNAQALLRKKSLDADNNNKKRLLKQRSDFTVKKDIFLLYDCENQGELSFRKKKEFNPDQKERQIGNKIHSYSKNINKLVFK